MRPTPKAPRTPATGHDTYRTGARRSTKPSAHCENRPSHQTQYPRFREITHALGVDYTGYTRAQAVLIVLRSGHLVEAAGLATKQSLRLRPGSCGPGRTWLESPFQGVIARRPPVRAHAGHWKSPRTAPG
jgi:hypothetical protein